MACTAKRVHAALPGVAIRHVVSNARDATRGRGTKVVGTWCNVGSAATVVVGLVAASGAVARVKVSVGRRRRRSVFYPGHVVVATLLVMRRVRLCSALGGIVVIGRRLRVFVVGRSPSGCVVAVVVGGIERLPLVMILVGIVLHHEAKANKRYKSKSPVLGRVTDTKSLNFVLLLPKNSAYAVGRR